MRKTYHVCTTSHDEVMFRCPEDYIRSFNCIAYAALETDSILLADSEMSSHCHSGLQTDSIGAFVEKSRYPYSRYFNSKYHRRGRLGEKQYFWLELDGPRHITTALSYIMRQGLHHGLTSTPYEYPYCSANVIYQKELGKKTDNEIISFPKRSKYLPREANIGPEYRMNKSGLLLREDIIETRHVEDLYISPKNFIFQMNRNSDDSLVKDQAEEESSSPIVTLDKIEPGASEKDIAAMLVNEKGRPNKSRMWDVDLCQMIDNEYVPRYARAESGLTIYDLSDSTRADLANQVWDDLKAKEKHRKPGVPVLFVTKEQLARCAVVR